MILKFYIKDNGFADKNFRPKLDGFKWIAEQMLFGVRSVEMEIEKLGVEIKGKEKKFKIKYGVGQWEVET